MDQHDRPMQEPPTLGEHKGFEVYPMPMFARLECADLERSRDWYVAALGFGAMFSMPGADGRLVMVHLRRRKYQDIMLVLRSQGAAASADGDAAAARPRSALQFDADGEVTALFERAKAATAFGRTTIVEPRVTPWNTRELQVTDPDGHALVFSERHDDPRIHEEWSRRFDEDRRAG